MFLREFFYFNKSDRQVIIFLLLLMIVGIVLFVFLSHGEETSDPLTTADSTYDLRRGNKHFVPSADRSESFYYGGIDRGKSPVRLFPFDPNTADSTQLLNLGLNKWQVRNIYRYRAAGGIYRKPSDFARLYGLTKKQYEQLLPYIHIADDYRPASDFVEKEPAFARDTMRNPVKLKPNQHVALNAADTLSLKKVPGIGSYYARQILNYRNRLGGFYAVSQLNEIEGFPAEALSYFTLGEEKIKKINLNRATLNQLRRHPYINFYQARAIVDIRRLRGDLKSLDELKLLKEFSDKDIERLSHYAAY